MISALAAISIRMPEGRLVFRCTPTQCVTTSLMLEECNLANHVVAIYLRIPFPQIMKTSKTRLFANSTPPKIPDMTTA